MIEPKLQGFWQDRSPPASSLVSGRPTSPQLHRLPPMWSLGRMPCGLWFLCTRPEWLVLSVHLHFAHLALSSLSHLSSKVSSKRPFTCSMPITGGVVSGLFPRPSLPGAPLRVTWFGFVVLILPHSLDPWRLFRFQSPGYFFLWYWHGRLPILVSRC